MLFLDVLAVLIVFVLLYFSSTLKDSIIFSPAVAPPIALEIRPKPFMSLLEFRSGPGPGPGTGEAAS